MSNTIDNLFVAFVCNAVSVLLAVGVGFPAFGLLFNPMITASASSLSFVSAIQRVLGCAQEVVSRWARALFVSQV